MNFRFRQPLRVRATALFLLAAAGAACAQTAPRSYGVMSLVGNSIAVHSVKYEIGIHLGGQSKSILAIDSPMFDDAVLRAADAALKRLVPGVKPVLMLTSDAGLYQAQNALFEAPAQNIENREYVKSLLRERGVTHLVLVTKLRENAAFKLLNGFAGSGSLEGLGFFIDDTYRTFDKKSLDTATGIMVPFAYLKVRLIDAATLEVLAEAHAMENTIVRRPSASSTGMDIWTSMTGEQKSEHMRALLGYAVECSVRKLLGSCADAQ